MVTQVGNRGTTVSPLEIFQSIRNYGPLLITSIKRQVHNDWQLGEGQIVDRELGSREISSEQLDPDLSRLTSLAVLGLMRRGRIVLIGNRLSVSERNQKGDLPYGELIEILRFVESSESNEQGISMGDINNYQTLRGREEPSWFFMHMLGLLNFSGKLYRVKLSDLGKEILNRRHS